MDFVAGIKGKDFVLLCTDTSATTQIVTIKQDEDKIVLIDSHKAFALSGEAGDRVEFSSFIIANIKLYATRNSTGLSTKAVANFARGELAKALRSSPYHTNMLIAGYDESTGASMYWMDYLATLNKVNTGGTGYGSYFTQSLFDKMWHPELTEAEALNMMEKGIEEVKRRLVVAPAHYIIKVIDKDGVRIAKEI